MSKKNACDVPHTSGQDNRSDIGGVMNFNNSHRHDRIDFSIVFSDNCTRVPEHSKSQDPDSKL